MIVVDNRLELIDIDLFNRLRSAAPEVKRKVAREIAAYVLQVTGLVNKLDQHTLTMTDRLESGEIGADECIETLRQLHAALAVKAELDKDPTTAVLGVIDNAMNAVDDIDLIRSRVKLQLDNLLGLQEEEE